MAVRYAPKRNDIVWLDFEPTTGREIGKYRPALVLSGGEYNLRSGLLICCPISTSIRNTPTEVPVDNLQQPCVVAANLIHTFDWTARKVKKAAEAQPGVMNDVLVRLIPLIGADQIIEEALREE